MVAVLFARADSIYKTMQGCDVWDIERDALKWPGGCPAVMHPPCRAWGRLRHFANPRPGEKESAIWAVNQVRTWGGVIEHPAFSSLWKTAQLPCPGSIDEFGGWTLPVLQFWFGHKAEKATWLYIVGCKPGSIPEIPLILGEATHVVAQNRRHKTRPELSKADRERTPQRFAEWLVDLASRCKR